ncbi:MAG: twin-arginine translocation signal domain-containing protein [Chloroflexi bacterium]|nr:MAG: twin-arginine translocation signal domain-containing protein [Chloroflexota bacterium]
MARSPLLRRFQALFEDFDEAEGSGRPLEVVREQRRQMRLTRRDFLKATGATEQGAGGQRDPGADYKAGILP